MLKQHSGKLVWTTYCTRTVFVLGTQRSQWQYPTQLVASSFTQKLLSVAAMTHIIVDLTVHMGDCCEASASPQG